MSGRHDFFLLIFFPFEARTCKKGLSSVKHFRGNGIHFLRILQIYHHNCIHVRLQFINFAQIFRLIIQNHLYPTLMIQYGNTCICIIRVLFSHFLDLVKIIHF